MHSLIKSDQNEEINLKEVFQFLIRNKITISLLTTISFIFSLFSVALEKKVWQGEFDIVLTNETQASLNLNFAESGNIQLGNNKNEIATDFEIIKSSSFLFDIFSYVKVEKTKLDRAYRNLNFQKWRDGSLSIRMKDGTSVVNFKYKDHHKELILPVLNKLNEAFQKYYSGKRSSESIILAERYFKNEVDKYKEKSKKSFTDFQVFSIENDLSTTMKEKNLISTKEDDQISNLQEIAPFGIIDKERVKSSNDIRFYENFLVKLKEIDITSGQLEYYAYLLPDFPRDNFLKIKNLNNRINSLSNSNNQNEKIIQDILLSKKIALEELKKDIVGVITALKTKSQLYKDAFTREDDVLVKYQELYLQATKDRITLEELENQNRLFKLIVNSNPNSQLELITKPTLLDEPINKNLQKVFIWGILGLIASLIISLIKEKKDDFVFSKNKFKNIFEAPLLGELPKVNTIKWDEIINIIFTQIDLNSGENLSILILGKIDTKEITIIDSILKKLKNYKDLKITSNILDAVKSKNLLLITELGVTKVEECQYLINSSIIKRPTIIGFLAIS